MPLSEKRHEQARRLANALTERFLETEDISPEGALHGMMCFALCSVPALLGAMPPQERAEVTREITKAVEAMFGPLDKE